MEIQEISSKTTIHKWCSELSETSKEYVRKLKKEMQDYLEMKHNMKNTNHVINTIDEMDELYYSKPENNIGSDNVFITPHLDGFLGWIPFMRCWRCIYCITNPNNGRVNSGSTTEMVFHAMRASENGQSSSVP